MLSTKLSATCGTWLIADAVYSLILYIPKGEPFWKCHSIRIIRAVVGLILVFFG